MNTKLLELKNEIKNAAVKNRELKREIKSTQKEKGSGAAWKQQGELYMAKVETRALLRAYGYLRNVPLDMIEPSCKTDKNSDTEFMIRRKTEKYIEQYQEETHEEG